MVTRTVNPKVGLLLGLLLSACRTLQPEVPSQPAEPVRPTDSVPVETPAPDQPISSSDTPAPTSDAAMRQGPIYVDEVELVMMESFPVQVRLILRGSLPNPCSSFAWEVEEPDSQGRIAVQAYSLQEADLACIQVLEPMEESIPLGAFTQGNFSVWLNGERVSEFEL